MILWILAALLVQDISWQPTIPREGSLILISAPNAIAGQVAGEPLHFHSGKALAAVPLSTTDGIRVRILMLRWDGALLGDSAWVRVVPRKAPVNEQVRADDRFTPAPDSALMVRIERERELMRAATRASHTVPRLWSAPFVRPRNSRVTSPFGTGRRVNGVWRSRHAGLDLAGAKGAPVRVSNRGVVALVGDFFYGGISIYVHHGQGLTTAYHHLSRTLVAVGDTVERGQLIGQVGATGRVTGPHLHWGAQYGNISFDPTDLLKLR